MIDMNRNTAITVAGICGTAFIGYCVYFDRKRRSHPDFKKKLRERRMKSQSNSNNSTKTKMPDLRNVEEVQKFFLEEVQRGEELLGQGSYEEGVEHLTNAVAVCGQPQQLLHVLQQTLPQPVFAMLLERLPTISQRISTAPTMSQIPEKKESDTATITDVDDLE